MTDSFFYYLGLFVFGAIAGGITLLIHHRLIRKSSFYGFVVYVVSGSTFILPITYKNITSRSLNRYRWICCNTLNSDEAGFWMKMRARYAIFLIDTVKFRYIYR